MGQVGGNRHYIGGGLGNEAGWKCPSCGSENMGPIAQGCQLCGAGKPGARAEAPPAPPRDAPPAARQGDVATYWAAEHPGATVAEAYRAGSLDGTRAARATAQQQAPAVAFSPETKIARTIVAALEYFADQVLRDAPQEVESGEWCSVEEVRALIQQLTTTGEVVHG